MGWLKQEMTTRESLYTLAPLSIMSNTWADPDIFRCVWRAERGVGANNYLLGWGASHWAMVSDKSVWKCTKSWSPLIPTLDLPLGSRQIWFHRRWPTMYKDWLPFLSKGLNPNELSSNFNFKWRNNNIRILTINLDSHTKYNVQIYGVFYQTGC